MNPTHNTYNFRQSGFTLIEVIVAIALLAIIIITVLTPMIGLFGFSRDSEDILDANTLSQQRLEEARAIVSANYVSPDVFNPQLKRLGVSCKDIGLFGDEMASSCQVSAAGKTPPLRRLIITVRKDNQQITSSVDVVSP